MVATWYGEPARFWWQTMSRRVPGRAQGGKVYKCPAHGCSKIVLTGHGTPTCPTHGIKMKPTAED